MLSRGYEGILPHDEPPHISKKVWLQAMLYPLVAAIIFVAQLMIGKM
jgi:hypothetical protein